MQLYLKTKTCLDGRLSMLNATLPRVLHSTDSDKPTCCSSRTPGAPSSALERQSLLKHIGTSEPGQGGLQLKKKLSLRLQREASDREQLNRVM